MVRAAAPLLGVVAHPGPLGVAVDDEDHRVQVEDQAAAGPGEERLPQLVVEAHQLPDVARSQPPQEPPQRGSVGELGEPHNLLEGPVVLEDLGRVDAVEPHDDGVEERQNQLGGMIVPVPRGGAQGLLQEPPEPEPLTKCLDQGHPREVREMGVHEGNRQISEPFRHCTQSYLLGRFLCKRNTPCDSAPFPSEKRSL